MAYLLLTLRIGTSSFAPSNALHRINTDRNHPNPWGASLHDRSNDDDVASSSTGPPVSKEVLEIWAELKRKSAAPSDHHKLKRKSLASWIDDAAEHSGDEDDEEDEEDDDDHAKRAIVKGVDTISKNDMPFVNRHKELWQLFRVNAEVCDRIAMSTEESISDFRDFDLLFCVQYFGAGKTTLGKEFPEKIKYDDAVKEFIITKLNGDGLKAEWERITHGNGIQRVLIDVRSVGDIVREAAAITSDNSDIQIRDPKHAAQHLIKYATDHGPTLFHFDEVGSDEEHNLDKLRKLVCAIWSQMHATCRDHGADAMPRIFFPDTGKSIEPFADVGSGSSGMGSYFLVLDMLADQQVRSHLHDGNQVQNPLRLIDLDDMRDGQNLNECLVQATGGAPRLLLNTSLASTEKIDAAVMETVFPLLHGVDVVASEFLPAPPSLKAFQL